MLNLPRVKQPSPEMLEIDRLGWSAGIAFRSYGLRIGVRTNRRGMIDRIGKTLPPGWQPLNGSVVDQLFSIRFGSKANKQSLGMLYQGTNLELQIPDAATLLDALEGCMQMYVAEWARHRVFVHAGVVAWKGQAAVIPGRSMSGKSTLVAELLRAGATYYSDEYAVLDGKGYVHAYPRRLSLRQPEGKPPRRCTAADLGSPTGRKPLRVGLVAVTKYLPGARWRPRPLTPGRAVLELLNNAVPALVKPEAVMKTLHQVAPLARTVMGARGEARETARAILEEMERAA